MARPSSSKSSPETAEVVANLPGIAWPMFKNTQWRSCPLNDLPPKIILLSSRFARTNSLLLGFVSSSECAATRRQ
jgi:hypothetical protein